MSRRPSSYTTKQGKAVLACLESQKGAHVTAAQIAEHLEQAGVSIGRTTIYRQLERLSRDGRVRKYAIDGAGACFQYADGCGDMGEHFHLKCEGCGEVVHLNGGMLPGITQDIRNNYEFEVDVNKTVFYGRCGTCVRPV